MVHACICVDIHPYNVLLPGDFQHAGNVAGPGSQPRAIIVMIVGLGPGHIYALDIIIYNNTVGFWLGLGLVLDMACWVQPSIPSLFYFHRLVVLITILLTTHKALSSALPRDNKVILHQQAKQGEI